MENLFVFNKIGGIIKVLDFPAMQIFVCILSIVITGVILAVMNNVRKV